MDSELNQNTRHGGADLAGVVRISLRSADVVNSSLLVNDGDLSDLAVHLEEDFTLAGVLREGTDSKELQNEDLALLELDVELLANLRSGEEVSSRKNGKITVLLDELLVVLKDLGIHDVRGDIAFGDGGTELLAELALDLGEVDGVEEQTGALIELASATESVGAQRLGESTEGLAHHTLEELENGAGEIQLRGTSLDILRRQAVGNHELGKVTDDLGGGGNFDNIAKEVVGVLIRLLGLKPLGSETQLRSLEHHVGQLTTRNLVLVHLGVGAGKVSLERRVEQTKLGPVDIESPNLAGIQTRVKFTALKGGEDGVDARLRGHARQAVGGSIDSVSTGLGASDHGSDTSTGRIVGVDVDGKVRVLFTDGTDEKGGGVGLEDTGHILDTQDVDVESDEPVDKVKVVLEVVLLLGVEHVTTVADGGLNDATSLVNGLDTNLKLVNIVQGIEHSENIDTVLLSLVNKVVDGIVRQGSVGNTVGATEQHLEGNVGDELAHLAEPVPGILVEETHGNIEGGTTPALKGVQVGESVAGLLGNVQEINGSDTRGQQRLVGVSPGGVHEKAALVITNSLGEGLRALLQDDVAPSLLARMGDIDLGTVTGNDLRHIDLAPELGLANLALDAAAVDGNVTEVGQQLLGTVLAANQVEE